MSVTEKYWQLVAGSIALKIYLIGEKEIRIDWVTLGLNEGLAVGKDKDDEPWGQQGEKTRWYKTMKLYRQKKFGQWGPVLKDLKKDLESLLKPLEKDV